MGTKRMDTVANAARHGGYLRITCLRCGRCVYMPVSELAMPSMFGRPDRIRVSTEIDTLGPRMRCRGGRGQFGCGHRGADVSLTTTLPATPAGIPPIQWLNADDRERKRLVQQARG